EPVAFACAGTDADAGATSFEEDVAGLHATKAKRRRSGSLRCEPDADIAARLLASCRARHARATGLLETVILERVTPLPTSHQQHRAGAGWHGVREPRDWGPGPRVCVGRAHPRGTGRGWIGVSAHRGGHRSGGT